MSGGEATIMRGIGRDLSRYVRGSFHAGLYATVAILLAGAIGVNYAFDFKRRVLNALFGRWLELPVYCLYYAIPYYGAVLLEGVFHRQASFLRSRGFWLASAFAIFVLAANRSLLMIPYTLAQWQAIPAQTAEYAFRLLVNVVKSLGLFLPVWIFWLLVDRGQHGLYGLNRRRFEWKRFLPLLLFVVPLVTAASFQASFLSIYPVYRPGSAEAYLGVPAWLTVGIHEMTYAFRFVSVELLFRGFLILGMVRWLGRSALLPMVVLYAFWHFGKPMGETVSSVFGAYILGVIALSNRSIAGCIVLHVGLALLMNLAAYVQVYVLRA